MHMGQAAGGAGQACCTWISSQLPPNQHNSSGSLQRPAFGLACFSMASGQVLGCDRACATQLVTCCTTCCSWLMSRLDTACWMKDSTCAQGRAGGQARWER